MNSSWSPPLKPEDHSNAYASMQQSVWPIGIFARWRRHASMSSHMYKQAVPLSLSLCLIPCKTDRISVETNCKKFYPISLLCINSPSISRVTQRKLKSILPKLPAIGHMWLCLFLPLPSSNSNRVRNVAEKKKSYFADFQLGFFFFFFSFFFFFFCFFFYFFCLTELYQLS